MSLSLRQNQKEKEAYLHIYLDAGSWREDWIASELCTVISYWSGCICATCWWHDWSISPGSASAPLITLLNITPGEALLEAQSLCLGNGVHWRPIQPFFLTLAHLNGPPVKPFSENMQPGFLGGLGLSWEFVNGLRDLAYWGTWTQWPKKSETKMSLTGTCRSEVDKSRHGPVKAIWLLSWKGNTEPCGGAVQLIWRKSQKCPHTLRGRHLPELQVVCEVILKMFFPSTCLCGHFLFVST